MKIQIQFESTSHSATRDGGTFIILAENEEGATEPVTIAASLDEAAELAESDFENRDHNEDMCPYLYTAWVRNACGKFVKVAEARI